MESVIVSLVVLVVSGLQIAFLVYLPYFVLRENGKALVGRWVLLTNGLWLAFIYGYLVYTWNHLDDWPVDVPGSGLLGIYLFGPLLIIFVEVPILMLYYLVKPIFKKLVRSHH